MPPFKRHILLFNGRVTAYNNVSALFGRHPTVMSPLELSHKDVPTSQIRDSCQEHTNSHKKRKPSNNCAHRLSTLPNATCWCRGVFNLISSPQTSWLETSHCQSLSRPSIEFWHHFSREIQHKQGTSLETLYANKDASKWRLVFDSNQDTESFQV